MNVNYTQLGDTINNVLINAQYNTNFNIELNNNGDTIVISVEKFNNYNGLSGGFIVFNLVNSRWIKKGNAQMFNTNNKGTNNQIRINNDGDRVLFYNPESKILKIFDYDQSNQDWIKIYEKTLLTDGQITLSDDFNILYITQETNKILVIDYQVNQIETILTPHDINLNCNLDYNNGVIVSTNINVILYDQNNQIKQIITNPELNLSDTFGDQISSSDKLLLISSIKANLPINNSGVIYIYEKNNNEWIYKDILEPGINVQYQKEDSNFGRLMKINKESNTILTCFKNYTILFSYDTKTNKWQINSLITNKIKPYSITLSKNLNTISQYIDSNKVKIYSYSTKKLSPIKSSLDYLIQNNYKIEYNKSKNMNLDIDYNYQISKLTDQGDFNIRLEIIDNVLYIIRYDRLYCEWNIVEKFKTEFKGTDIKNYAIRITTNSEYILVIDKNNLSIVYKYDFKLRKTKLVNRLHNRTYFESDINNDLITLGTPGGIITYKIKNQKCTKITGIDIEDVNQIKYLELRNINLLIVTRSKTRIYKYSARYDKWNLTLNKGNQNNNNIFGSLSENGLFYSTSETKILLGESHLKTYEYKNKIWHETNRKFKYNYKQNTKWEIIKTYNNFDIIIIFDKDYYNYKTNSKGTILFFIYDPVKNMYQLINQYMINSQRILSNINVSKSLKNISILSPDGTQILVNCGSIHEKEPEPIVLSKNTLFVNYSTNKIKNTDYNRIIQ